MSKIRIYARNLAANWIGYGAMLAVAFFMSPFIVHTLGDARYGVWTLLTSLTGYLGLVDVGVRGATGRYINYHMGRGEDDEVSNVVSTSLLFYTLISVLIFAASAALAFFFSDLFPKIQPEFAHEAQIVLLLLGVNVWIGLFSSTFTQLLLAAERFDLQMISDVTVLALRTGATIWVLITGGGLVELALVLVASGLLGCLLVGVLARWKGPRAQIHWRHFRWASFKEVFSYGSWAFVGTAANQLGIYASSAIIGILIGAAEITLYSIGAMLVGYGSSFLSRLNEVMVPDILKAGGRGDHANLMWLMGKGSRATMFLGVPILVGFMTLGREFITVWMGPGYTPSAWVLLILTMSQFGLLANGLVGMTVTALGHVRLWSAICVVQSLAALVLSVGFVLITDWGIYGIAIGTTLPLVLTSNIWAFSIGYRKVGASPVAAARSITLRWVTGSILFAVPCILIAYLIPSGGWGLFWLKVGILAIVYIPIGLFTVLQRSERRGILARARPWRSLNTQIPLSQG
jgi:O-antigen/teichoic acid export membrane protein